MKWILSIFIMLASISVYGQKADTTSIPKVVQPSAISLTKSDYFLVTNKVRLANKIQLVRDSLKYVTIVAMSQDSALAAYRDSYNLAQEQLQNREQAVADLTEENAQLRQVIADQTPSWYENKWLWFAGGVVTAIITGISTK
jgi:hypothetical protein